MANTQDMTDEELAAFTATQDAEDVKTVTALAQRVIFNLREITAKQSAQEIQKQAVVAEPGKAEPEDEHDFETPCGAVSEKQICLSDARAVQAVWIF